MSAFADLLREFTAFAERYCACAERLISVDLLPVLRSCALGAQSAAGSIEKLLMQRYDEADSEGKGYLDRMATETGAVLMLRAANGALVGKAAIGTPPGMAALVDLHAKSGRLLRQLAAVETGSALGELFAWLDSIVGGIPALLAGPAQPHPPFQPATGVAAKRKKSTRRRK